MKILVDVVVSINGYIARENGDEDWLPEDGWEAFLKQIEKYQNCIIGRETYDLVKAKYEHENFDAIITTRKIIVTKDSEYTAGKDYDIAHSPEEAVEIVQKAGLETAYVGGGGKLITSFFEAGLLDELRLTLMPCIISSGRPFLANSTFKDVQLELIKSENLGHGRLVNDYRVVK